MDSKKPHIDIELLKRYYNNELNDLERNALEQEALNDPFLKEAMDGFDEHPGSFNRFYEKNKHLLKQRKSYTFLIAVVALIGLFAVTLFIKDNFNPDNNQIATNDNPTDTIIENILEEDDFDTEEYEVIPVEIETLSFIPNVEMISVDEVVNYQEQTHPTQPKEEAPIIINDVIIEEEHYTVEDEKWHKHGQVNVATSYLFDLMVVDYREIDRENQKISYKRYELSGTSADRENGEDTASELIETEVQVPYYSYLRKSMSFFAESSFKKALNRYNLILEQYPNDLNALFYGGLSYYNLGEYKKSVLYFDRILVAEDKAFGEETRWYKAKSLIALGKKSEAKELLNEIIAIGGFYTKEAIDLKARI